MTAGGTTLCALQRVALLGGSILRWVGWLVRDVVWVGSKRCVWVGSKRWVWVIEVMVEVIVIDGWMWGLYDDDMRWLLNRKPRHSITTKQIDCK